VSADPVIIQPLQLKQGPVIGSEAPCGRPVDASDRLVVPLEVNSAALALHEYAVRSSRLLIVVSNGLVVARTVVVFSTGSAWEKGRGSRQQPHWDAHAAFIDGLTDRGLLLAGGPFADESGAMSILACSGGSRLSRDALLEFNFACPMFRSGFP
jgi:hypothetical protein